MRTTSRVCLGLAVLGALGVALSRDEPRVPPLLQELAARHVSHDGRHAILVAQPPVITRSTHHGDRHGLPVYVLLRAEPGSALTEWKAPGPRKRDPLPAQPTLHESVGHGTVVMQGVMPWTSAHVRVLNDGGFVLVKAGNHFHAHDDQQVVVQRHDAHGKLAWGRTLATILRDQDPPRAAQGADAWITWERGAWVDEHRGLLVIIGWDDTLSVLSLDDGRTVTSVDEYELIGAALGEGREEGQAQAFELSCRREWAERLLPPEETLADTTKSESMRLWAATVLADRGDLTGAELVVAVAKRSLTPGAVMQTDAARAWRSLGACLGAASVPLYLERLSQPTEYAVLMPAEVRGLVSLGEPAFEVAIQLWLRMPPDSAPKSRYEWLLEVLRSGSTAEVTLRDTGNGAAWNRLRSSAAAEDLASILGAGIANAGADRWSLLILPAARWAALHPRPEYAATLGTFRKAFAVEPRCRDGWRDRVLAEVDAALAACGGS